MSINVIDAADKFREIWELDDAELDDWQDPFEDAADDALPPDMPPGDMPPQVLTQAEIRAAADAARHAARDYLESDPQRAAIWASVSFLPATEVAGMLQMGASGDECRKADTQARGIYEKTGVEARRDCREAILQQYDELDVVSIAHARGDALHDFDATAKLLGYHSTTWSSGQDRREKEREKKLKVGAAASRMTAAVAAQKSDAAAAAAAAGSTPTNAENYAAALEPEWHSSAPPELKPEPILTNENSIYAPKPPCRAPKIKNAQAQQAQAQAQQAATQRAQAKAQRLAAFDAAFGRVRRVVCCAIADALCFAPDALKYEWQRADIFYHAARDEAARAQNYDAASAALKYQNARLRSLKNAVKETSCKKVF